MCQWLQWLQLQLQKAQKDYGGLVEQLQIQREAAAGSLNKLQQKSKEEITELKAKIENLTIELQEVGTAILYFVKLCMYVYVI